LLWLSPRNGRFKLRPLTPRAAARAPRNLKPLLNFPQLLTSPDYWWRCPESAVFLSHCSVVSDYRRDAPVSLCTRWFFPPFFPSLTLPSGCSTVSKPPCKYCLLAPPNPHRGLRPPETFLEMRYLFSPDAVVPPLVLSAPLRPPNRFLSVYGTNSVLPSFPIFFSHPTNSLSTPGPFFARICNFLASFLPLPIFLFVTRRSARGSVFPRTHFCFWCYGAPPTPPTHFLFLCALLDFSLFFFFFFFFVEGLLSCGCLSTF